MIHKILKAFTLAIAFSTLSFAQDIEVHIGQETKAMRKEYMISLHRTDDGIVVLKGESTFLASRGDYFIEVFDNQMNFVSRNEIEIPDKDLVFSEIKYINDKIYFFMEKYDKSTKINSIYGTILSLDGKLGDVYEITTFEVEKRRKKNDFDMFLSADSTNFLIKVTPPTLDKNQMANRQYIVLDLDFKEVDNIQINFPFKERDFSISRSHMDTKGNIHMLCLVNIEEEKRSTIFKSSVEKEARVFTLYKGESDIEEYTISFKNDDAGFISQIKMKTDDLGRLQCAGFYSDKKGNSTKGVFVFTIDPETKAVSNVSSQEFTDEYLTSFMTDRQIRKKERKRNQKKEINPYDKLYNYKVRDLVMKKGGGFYMVAEFYRYYTTSSTDQNGVTRTTHHYRYNDLMVINVLEDNSVDWYSKVSKYQHSTNDNGYYSGIVMGLNKDNSLNILFNDDRDNVTMITHDNTKRMKFKRMKTVLVKFELDGNATKTPLFDAKNSKNLIVPSLSTQDKPNDIVLYSNVKRKIKFTNIRLK